MPEFTESEIERLRQLRWLLGADDAHIKAAAVKFDDVRLLIRRVAELDLDEYHGADEIMQFTLRRLQEDLRNSQAHLEEMVEMTRIAELQVKEATHALAATKALLDGEMYAAGAEVNIRWDELETEFRVGGFYPPSPEAPAEPAAEEPAAEPPEPESAQQPPEPAQPEPGLVEEPAKAAWGSATRGREPVDASAQEAAVFAALKVCAGAEPEIQVSLTTLAEHSDVPKGSMHAVLRRLEDANLITIIPPPPGPGSKPPNTYRFVEAQKQDEAPKVVEPPAAEPEAEEPPKADDPVAAYVAANPDVQAAYEAAQTTTPPPVSPGRHFKPSGAVKVTAPLRERILGTLQKAACTTSGLASMLDVKELSISQTLSAMEHEGTVKADEMPDAGRRAQLWRLAPEPAPAA